VCSHHTDRLSRLHANGEVQLGLPLNTYQNIVENRISILTQNKFYGTLSMSYNYYYAICPSSTIVALSLISIAFLAFHHINAYLDEIHRNTVLCYFSSIEQAVLSFLSLLISLLYYS
jgi:hypothetical protein